jgi:hypothetical protein
MGDAVPPPQARIVNTGRARRADRPSTSGGAPLTEWLGRQDSNLGMAVPKTAALPLGDAPMAADHNCRGGAKQRRPIRTTTSLAGPQRCGLRARGALAISGPRERRSVAQSGSAPRSGRGGRRFKSCHSDQCFNAKMHHVRGTNPRTIWWRAVSQPPRSADQRALCCRALAADRSGRVSFSASRSKLGEPVKSQRKERNHH